MTEFDQEAIHDRAYEVRETELLRDLEVAVRRADMAGCTPILVQLTELRYEWGVLPLSKSYREATMLTGRRIARS